MSGQVKYLKWITRDMLRAEPDAVFVFGDNLARKGLGGQAKEMRGEPNALGVATKRRPGFFYLDYFDYHTSTDRLALEFDLAKVADAISAGKTVYAPLEGLGTGLCELSTRAPKLHNLIVEFFRDLPGEECPWRLV